ncbi:transcriptional regulation of mitochondrial recombination-domain-containing protein [Xylaria nigripes]|nr:transcriptional regulation of mitochondrial recombination-domain-containing protein [Xylaria nigripes]
MSKRISQITAQLGRLTIGGPFSRTSIRFTQTAVSKKQKEKQEDELFKPDRPDRYEKIFVFNHFLDGMTAYSFEPAMKAMHALKQLPFSGKHSKPSKVRKDYWRLLAIIQFGEEHKLVSRSAYQLLRECKKMHMYDWDDSLLFGENKRMLKIQERARRINDQRANTIADIAAILGGLGKGNKMWVKNNVQGADEGAAKEDVEGEGATKKDVEGEVEQVKAKVVDEINELNPATIFWANIDDRHYAIRWSKNVKHKVMDDSFPVPKAEKLVPPPYKVVTEPEPTKSAE